MNRVLQSHHKRLGIGSFLRTIIKIKSRQYWGQFVWMRKLPLTFNLHHYNQSKKDTQIFRFLVELSPGSPHSRQPSFIMISAHEQLRGQLAMIETVIAQIAVVSSR